MGAELALGIVRLRVGRIGRERERARLRKMVTITTRMAEAGFDMLCDR